MRHVIVGTAGHIDHGKSTLVRALTGIDPDRLKEEKARGITIDLGFAHDVRGDVTLGFVDVPGHERFVKNMLAGATGIDVLLLVVAADESVMPQTREHFDICRLLQVRAGVIAVTKADLVDRETLDLVTLEARELVAGSFLEAAPVVAVSARSGAGLDELRAALLAAAEQAPPHRRDGAFRLPVDRVFSIKGFGTVVTGTVMAGHVEADETLEVQPAGRLVKVRGLQGHGAAVSSVGAGQRAAINLAAVEVEDLQRGDSLVAPGSLGPTRRLDASLEVLPSARPIKHGARVRFHQGTIEVLGRVAVSQLAGPETGTAGALGEIPPGARAHVRLRLEAPVVVTRGDRFVLRAYSPSITVAGGAVLDPLPARGAIRTAEGRRRFSLLDPGARAAFDQTAVIDRALTTMLAERGGQGLASAQLVSRMGLTPGAARQATERLTASGAGILVEDALVDASALVALEDGLVRLLAIYHAEQPLSDGLPREEARERLFARAHPAVFDAVVARLVGARRILARDRLALASHSIVLSSDEERARQLVEQRFRESGLRPPDPGTLAGELGLPGAAVNRALTLLQRQKVLVKIDTLWFHVEALERLKQEVRALKPGGAQGQVDVGAFKDRYGVSRKYAIPLLEFLDRERVTRRVGEGRVVL